METVNINPMLREKNRLLFELNILLSAFLLPCGYLPLSFYLSISHNMIHAWYYLAAREILLLSPIMTLCIHFILRNKTGENQKAAKCERWLLACVTVLTILSALATAYEMRLYIVLNTNSIIVMVLSRGFVNCIGLVLVMIAISNLRKVRDKNQKKYYLKYYSIMLYGGVWVFNGYFSGTFNVPLLTLTLVLSVGYLIIGEVTRKT